MLDQSKSLQLPQQPGFGRVHFLQHTFGNAFGLRVAFVSSHDSVESKPINRIHDRFEADFHLKEHLYQETVLPKLCPLQHPFNENRHRHFADSMAANILSSVKHFTGYGKIDTWDHRWVRPEDGEDLSWGLFTTTPALGQRGRHFTDWSHLLLLLEIDFDLTVDIINSWINLVGDRGEVPIAAVLGYRGDERLDDRRLLDRTRGRGQDIIKGLVEIITVIISLLESPGQYHGIRSHCLRDKTAMKQRLLRAFESFEAVSRSQHWFFSYGLPRLNHPDIDAAQQSLSDDFQPSTITSCPTYEPNIHIILPSTLCRTSIKLRALHRLAIYLNHSPSIVTSLDA